VVTVATERATKSLLHELIGPAPEGWASPSVDALREVLASPNVVGVGVADKESGGTATNEVALTFYVEKKYAKRRVLPAALVPVAIPRGRGVVRTDVIEVGAFEPDVDLRVLQPGMSVGHVDTEGGTLGAIVRHGGALALLSNSHVLAISGTARLGSRILVPAKRDGGSPPANVVARLRGFVPFDASGTFVNSVDAAFAEIDVGDLDEVSAEILGLGIPRGVAAPRRGMRIVKMGRRTGVTTGVVKATDFAFTLEYRGVGSVGFANQVLATRYSAGGDSGSLILSEDDHRAVGLHFASSPKGGSVFTPIQTVLDALGLELVTERAPSTMTRRPEQRASRRRAAEKARRQAAAEVRRHGAHAIGVERNRENRYELVAYAHRMPGASAPRSHTVTLGGKTFDVPIRWRQAERFTPD
jgi:hypothetical protein